jgi:hypothetical protein
VRFAEDAKVDPSNCLMETPVLRENEEGIRIIRRSPGDYAKHLPWVLECVFLQTSCGSHNDEQGRCVSSDAQENSNQRESSDVRGNGSRCMSGDLPGSRDQ